MKEGKVILLHGFSQEEMSKILRVVKAAVDDPQEIAFAMTTPTNLQWKIKDFINDVRGDHEYLRQNPPGKDKTPPPS